MRKLVKISDFARLAGINRKNLIFYDEIGLLCPEYRYENGYRYYTYRQLETVSVITSLREIGMPLADIKRYLDERTPSSLIELFTYQRDLLEQRIDKLLRLQFMIDTRLSITRRGLEINPASILLKQCTKERLLVSEDITGLDEDATEDAVGRFYDFCDQEQIIYGYPFCTIISRQNLEKKKWNLPSYFFFKFPAEEKVLSNKIKPAGLYLIAFGEASYHSSELIYQRMWDYIEKEGLTIAGDAYEEFLLDEIAVKAPENYLLQVSMQVKPKK